MQEQQSEFYVDQYGNRIVEGPTKTGDELDVGFGGPIEYLMEKLAHAKKVMALSDERYPYEQTGVKKRGKLTTIDQELKQSDNKPLKTLREELDNDYEPTPPSIKQLSKTLQKPSTPQTATSVTKKQPIYEDNNYIYYAKNGVQEEEQYDVRQTPSLSQELLMGTQQQVYSKLLSPINEQMIQTSKLPDVIKQSFLKNPLTPPKLTVALGGAQLDAITEQFRKQKLLKNKQKPTEEVIAVPKKTITEQKVEPIPQNKREKIKAQLRPIVKELIREILLDKL